MAEYLPNAQLRLARDFLSAKLGGSVGSEGSVLRLARDFLSAKLDVPASC